MTSLPPSPTQQRADRVRRAMTRVERGVYRYQSPIDRVSPGRVFYIVRHRARSGSWVIRTGGIYGPDWATAAPTLDEVAWVLAERGA